MDGAVVVLVMDLENLQEVVLQVVHRSLVLLAPRHVGDHVAEDADEHVEQGEAAEEDEHQEHEGQTDRDLPHHVHHVSYSVQECPVQQQDPHRLADRTECWCKFGECLCLCFEDDTEEVDQHNEQQDGEEDRTHRQRYALQHCQYLWEEAQQPRDPAELREPQQPQHPEDGDVPKGQLYGLGVDEYNRQHDPGLAHHQHHEGQVEAEPAVLQALHLLLVGEEADEQLRDERRAEEVLRDLEVSWSLPNGG
mmetsp:Transcript_51249/g.146333  ORF Transcript_51249/g.146333 Transcript_51249/m.146333 type:complete len:250 (+) Transcript_51249:738-1487(+)